MYACIGSTPTGGILVEFRICDLYETPSGKLKKKLGFNRTTMSVTLRENLCAFIVLTGVRYFYFYRDNNTKDKHCCNFMQQWLHERAKLLCNRTRNVACLV